MRGRNWIENGEGNFSLNFFHSSILDGFFVYIYIYIFGSSNGLSSMMEYLLSVYRSRYFSSTFHRYARTVVIEYRPLNRYLSKGRIYISQRFRSTRSSFRKVRSILGSLSLGKHRRFERIPVFFKRFHYRGTR